MVQHRTPEREVGVRSSLRSPCCDLEQDTSKALEVWPLNPLKCLKYEITVSLRIAMYTTVNLMISKPNRTSSACGYIHLPKSTVNTKEAGAPSRHD